MTEQDIILKIKSGDTSQYRYLVDRYSKMSYAIAYRIVPDADDCQDIVQDAFISAYENLKDFKGDAKFSTWLYRIVTNKALTFKNKLKYFEDVDTQPIEDEPYEETLENMKAEWLKLALTQLTDSERLVIDLFYYQEQTIKEIGYICHLTEANIKVLLHRARKKMNDFLQKKTKFATNE